MSMHSRWLPFLAAAALGVGSAFLMACGDRNGLISSTVASSLDSALRDIAAATASGDCVQATAAIARAKGVLLELPDSVDSRLRTRLRAGIDNLEKVVPDACLAPQSEPEPETQPPPSEPTGPQTTPIPTGPQTTPVPTGPQTTPVPTGPQTTPSVPAATVPPDDGTGGANGDGGA